MTLIELQKLKKQLQELLDNGFIRSILFVQKKDRSIKICIDYKELNTMIVKNKYPLLRIDDLFDQLKGVSTFLKIDLRSCYHQVWVTKQDLSRITFVTKYGYYKFVVMPFGLINALTMLIDLMNKVFKTIQISFWWYSQMTSLCTLRLERRMHNI